MRIEQIERPAGLLLDKPRPGAHPRTGVAPGNGARHLGRIGKPERPRFVHLEANTIVQNRRVLALCLAVITSHADHLVHRHGL
ncbi:MAG: hypothetical protein WBC22_13065, partial [Sedimentisphaerales bacterium]